MSNELSRTEEEIVADFHALRQIRRDQKESIVRMVDTAGDPLFLTSVVYTSPIFAKKIIDYFAPQFQPNDTFLDPCAGRNAFFNNLPLPKHRCEIQDGKDFLTFNTNVSWTFANFPWRGTHYTKLINHAFKLSDNVVSLVKYSTAIGTKKRWQDMFQNNHNIKEVIFCDWQDAGFTFHNGNIKQPEGFILAIIHYQKNWNEGTTWSNWWK
jgi:hypothetical protein